MKHFDVINELGMTLDSPLGIYLDEKHCSAGMLKFLHSSGASFVILECTDISSAITALKDIPRETNIIAHLDKHKEYSYQDKKKDLVASYALLYDFVDAFVISGFDELSDDVDQLINIRMYNDEYRPVLMMIPDNLLYEDMDEIIAYARMSNVDGLFVSNQRLLKYAASKAPGSLTLISENPGNINDITGVLDVGATLVCLRSDRHPLLSAFKVRRLLRKLRKLLLQ